MAPGAGHRSRANVRANQGVRINQPNVFFEIGQVSVTYYELPMNYDFL